MNENQLKSTLVILPSRGRPSNVKEVIDSFIETRAQSKSHMIVALDDDDNELSNYLNIIESVNDRTIGYASDERIRMIPTVNRTFDIWPDYDYYCFVGDDHRFRTYGWDAEAIRVLEEKTNGWGIWYGDDLLQGENIPTAGVMSGKLAREIGFIALPGLIHLHMDTFWKRIGDELGIIHYDPNHIIEHMHYTIGKSEVDDQYLEVNAGSMYAHDGEVLGKWYDGPEREAMYEKVREAMTQ